MTELFSDDRHYCDTPPTSVIAERWNCPDCGRSWTSVSATETALGSDLVARGHLPADAVGWQALEPKQFTKATES